MPFSLRNSTLTFQHLINKVLHELPFIYLFINYIQVAHSNIAEYKQDLYKVFQRLVHFGICINLDKCTFSAANINFLRYNIDTASITLLPEKIKAIQDFPTATSVRQLRYFIGLTFIEDLCWSIYSHFLH